jgi:DnaD/phage-associated family protein
MAKRSTKGFSGFPEGKLKSIPIPNQFFSELLPAIDHLGEFKVSVYAFWALVQKEGRFRYMSRDQIAGDELFMRSLEGAGLSAAEALDDALERAVARGTLLLVTLEDARGSQAYYFLNSAKGRAAVKAVEDGDWMPSGDPEAPLDLSIERPNIFNLYEKNIGPLTPMIAETLRDAEQTYPASWIEDAMRIAVENNVRKWRYVEAILEDWQTQGRHEREDRGDSEKSRRRYVEGKYANFIEH